MADLVLISKMAELTTCRKHFIKDTKSAMGDRNDWMNSNSVLWFRGRSILGMLRSVKDGQRGWDDGGVGN